MKPCKGLFIDIIKPTVVMLCICILVTLALSGTNLLTADRIEGLALEKQQQTMQRLIKDAEFEEKALKEDGQEVSYYEAKRDGETLGYIFVTAAKGYGGDISVMTALDTEATVTAVEILDASGETPGLGQNVTNESFYSQYVGRFTEDTVAVKSGTASNENEIDAVTGATISSRAVTAAVNEAIHYASGNLVPDTKQAEVDTNEK